MRVSLVKFGSLLLLCARPFAPVRAFTLEDFRVQRPDFCQVDDRYGELPGGGHYHCVPTAVSNHLVSMGEQFPNLVPKAESTQKSQVEIIRKLSSPGYMNTGGRGKGTYLEDLIRGLKKYVKERGYDISIKYKGEEDEDSKDYFQGENITPEWIKEELKGKSNLILSVKFYTKRENGDLSFIGGHAVSVVGFNDDNGFKLHIHDPAERSGLEPQTETCDLIPHSGNNMELHGIKLQPTSDIALLRYALAFKIEHPKDK